MAQEQGQFAHRAGGAALALSPRHPVRAHQRLLSRGAGARPAGGRQQTPPPGAGDRADAARVRARHEAALPAGVRLPRRRRGPVRVGGPGGRPQLHAARRRAALRRGPAAAPDLRLHAEAVRLAAGRRGHPHRLRLPVLRHAVPDLGGRRGPRAPLPLRHRRGRAHRRRPDGPGHADGLARAHGACRAGAAGRADGAGGPGAAGRADGAGGQQPANGSGRRRCLSSWVTGLRARARRHVRARAMSTTCSASAS
mmetsp:Transcript_55126/g.176664  ORF Transcript_55126/g.176664 Transcript_55126/m.176664 type:complete len:253 (-) Transcript_55126:260-1018(-)